MNDSPRIVLVGNGSYANRGCEAIVRGITRIIRRRFATPAFVLCSFGKESEDDAKRESDRGITHRPLGGRVPGRTPSPMWVLGNAFKFVNQRLSNKFRYRSILRSLPGSSCAMEIGGDNYTLDYGVLKRYIELDREIVRTGTPLVLFGCSIGPFSADPAIEKVMSVHLGKFAVICARETETVKYLASIGVEENVRLTADPAFALEPVEPDVPEELRRFIEARPVAVNLSPLAGRFFQGGKDAWRAVAAACVEELLRSGVEKVLLVPHVIRTIDNDHKLLSDIARSLPGYAGRVCVVPGDLTAAGYKWAIARSRVFAGARTHSTIAALSSEVPTLMIGYSMKARGLAKDIYGSEEWLVPVQDLEPVRFAARVAQLLAREDELRAHLRSVIPAQVSRAFQAADYVAEVLRA